jgi:hypothetical protein
VASPDATQPEELTGRLLVFSDYGVDIHDSFESWLRDRLIVEQASQRQQRFFEERRQVLLREMRTQPVPQLLDRMPQPGWLERRALDLPGLPGPAPMSKIEAAETRIGIRLPPSLRTLYTHHDGFPPWAIVPLEHLRHLEEEASSRRSSVSRFDDSLVFHGTEGDSELRLEAADLRGCLIVGETPAGSLRNEALPVILWCPELDVGEPEVLDLSRHRRFPSLDHYFQFTTAERLLYDADT